MTTTSERSREQTVQVLGLDLHLLQGGTGDPLLIIHHDIGNPGWLALYDELAGRYTVSVPELPGYGSSDRPAWARHPRDLAIAVHLLLDSLGVASTALVGLGFGGWVAAEMACMNQRRFPRLVLVGAMGIRPSEGQIFDQMMVSADDYVRNGFSTAEAFEQQYGSEPSRDQMEAWEVAREMTARIAWKPYMFSHQLPHLLGGVQIPTLLVWGRDDRVVPVSCGEAYARALPNATLTLVEGAGHLVDLEKPEELARLIAGHLGAR